MVKLIALAMMNSFRGWLYKCEQFFELNRIPAQNKIKTVFFHLYGDALEWHQNFMEDKKDSHVSWEKYVQFMGLRFDKNVFKRPMIQLKKMNYEGTVQECQREFERVRFQAHFSKEQVSDMFLGGLKEKLQCYVAALHPTSVMEAFHYATLYETAFNSDINPSPAMTTLKQKPTYNRNQGLVLPTPSYKKKPYNPYPTMQTNSNSNLATRNQNQIYLNNKLPLTNAEYKENRAKNQCFWCESKFTQDIIVRGRDCIVLSFVLWWKNKRSVWKPLINSML